MKLRFNVDRAECVRRGIGAPRSVVIIEVNPADLKSEERHLIADRVDGMDVMQLWVWQPTGGPPKLERTGGRIVAAEPTLDELLNAVRQNEDEVKREFVERGAK